jgi:hypothetical protein
MHFSLKLDGIIVAYTMEFTCSFVFVQGPEGFLNFLAVIIYYLGLVSLSLLLPLRSCRKVQYSFLAL